MGYLDYCTGPQIRVNHKTCHLSLVICHWSRKAAGPPGRIFASLRLEGGGTSGLNRRPGLNKQKKRKGGGVGRGLPRARAAGLLSGAPVGLHKVGRRFLFFTLRNLRNLRMIRRPFRPDGAVKTGKRGGGRDGKNANSRGLAFLAFLATASPPQCGGL